MLPSCLRGCACDVLVPQARRCNTLALQSNWPTSTVALPLCPCCSFRRRRGSKLRRWSPWPLAWRRWRRRFATRVGPRLVSVCALGLCVHSVWVCTCTPATGTLVKAACCHGRSSKPLDVLAQSVRYTSNVFCRLAVGRCALSRTGCLVLSHPHLPAEELVGAMQGVSAKQFALLLKVMEQQQAAPGAPPPRQQQQQQAATGPAAAAGRAAGPEKAASSGSTAGAQPLPAGSQQQSGSAAAAGQAASGQTDEWGRTVRPLPSPPQVGVEQAGLLLSFVTLICWQHCAKCAGAAYAWHSAKPLR